MYDFTGQTALITGASSGLGVEFARALAARGANLVLVARRLDRLKAVADEITASFDVTVTVIARDLSRPQAGSTLVADIARRKIDLDVVINNAGFGTYGPLETENPARIADEVALNVGAVVDISRAALPGMLARNVGAIINVASTAAFQPLPNFATYGATKAFVLSFSEALWGETENSGVRVLALCPGPTATEFFDVAGTDAVSGPMAPASDVIATALTALDRRQPSVIHGANNRFTAFATRFASRKAVIRLARRVMSKNRPG